MVLYSKYQFFLVSNLPVMHFSSNLESDKVGYYHPLPDSESSSTSETDLKNEKRNKIWHEDAAEGGSQEHEGPQGVSAHRKTHINKYALGGAILASTNSVLLGYGEFHIPHFN